MNNLPLTELQQDKLNWIISCFGNVVNEDLIKDCNFNVASTKTIRLDLDTTEIDKLYKRDVQKRLDLSVKEERYEHSDKLKKILDTDCINIY